MKPTQEQVIAWAREAGFETAHAQVYIVPGEMPVMIITSELQAACILAYEAGRKDENEACAKMAENRWLNKANCTAEEMYEMQKKNIADAIRARMETNNAEWNEYRGREQ